MICSHSYRCFWEMKTKKDASIIIYNLKRLCDIYLGVLKSKKTFSCHFFWLLNA